MKTQLILALLVVSAVSDLSVLTNSKLSSVHTSNDVESTPTSYPPFDPIAFNLRTERAPTANQVISNAQSINLTPTRSIDSLFTRLPSSTELDELILSADSVAILKTIQTLASDDSLPCQQIVAYLLELLGRIRCAIEKKQFAADQLKIIIDAAKAEIARLEAEIKSLEDQKKSFWLDELRDQLRDLVAKLEPLYREFNNVESQIAPNEAKIAGFEKEIELLKRNNDQERNRLANDRLKLTETEANIRSLKQQLADAEAKQSALEDSIAKSMQATAENNKKIKDAQDKIADLEKVIQDLRDKSDNLRRKINDLEVQVERLRTDISVASTKTDKIDDQIEDLKNKIRREDSKVNERDYDDLLDMVKTLERFLPTVQAEIDRQYYFCYGDGSVQTVQTGSTIVYVVRGESFATYIQTSYGQSVALPGPKPSGSYQFGVVDIFSPVFTSRYGKPFPSGSFSKGNSFAGDFSCLNPSVAVSNSGKISKIEGNRIHVAGNDGKEYGLKLGACSRIEATSRVPEVGQSIVFKGVPSGAQGYNLYAATCC